MTIIRRPAKATGQILLPAAGLFAVTGALTAPVLAQTQSPVVQSGAKLTVLSPRAGDAVGGGMFALDVRFESRSTSPVVSAELWVDGVRWVERALDTPQTKNVLSFNVDASTLAEGAHTLLVKVLTQDGQASQTQLQIVAGSNGVAESNLSGPEMAFRTPVNGKRVSGTVELLLDAKARAGVNPYVTFYVDKQFKTLKNFPPYSYTWDTTMVANGYHTVEAMGYLESTNASTVRRMQVYVDNAGGNTDLKTDVPDLRRVTKTPVANAARTVAPANPQTAPALAARPAVSAATATAKPLALPLPRPATSPVLTKVSRSSVAVRSLGMNAEVANVEAETVAPVRSAMPRLPRPVVSGTVKSVASTVAPAPVVVPLTVRPRAVQTVKVAKVTKSAGATLTLPLPVAPRATIVSPITRVTVAAPVAVKPAPVSPIVRKTALATPRASFKPQSRNIELGAEPKVLIDVVRPSKAVQVAFDGTRIAFDVQPRVEKGLPLAPFRQIFEHTGGQVQWVPETRVIRAVNADREIVIAVGRPGAKINGQNVTLARPAYIEQGRAIVPLSFVGQALDVDVKYDAKTGRIQITSKN